MHRNGICKLAILRIWILPWWEVGNGSIGPIKFPFLIPHGFFKSQIMFVFVCTPKKRLFVDFCWLKAIFFDFTWLSFYRVWRGIIKEKKTLCFALSLALKNVNGTVNLVQQVFWSEIAIPIDAWFEDDPCFPETRNSQYKVSLKRKQTLKHHQAPYQASNPTPLSENQTPWLIAHHPLEVVCFTGVCNPVSLVEIIW